jgi:hypothetical protein
MSFSSSFKTLVADVEAKITGEVGRLNISDDVAKAVATAKVAEYLVKEFTSSVTTTWAQLDGQSIDAVLSSTIGLLHSGEYEQAALGLVYVIYQKAVEVTNTLEKAVSSAVSTAEAATGTATSTTAAAATPTAASATPAATATSAATVTPSTPAAS